MRRNYKNLNRRYSRNLYYGRLTNKLDRLSIPMTNFVVNYFESYSPFDYLDPEYANRLSMEGSVGPTTLIVAMIYLERLRIMNKDQFESSDPADLFSSALLCASKYLYDNDDAEFVYNDEWAASCSKSLSYINSKEVEFLNGISWNLIARQDDFLHALLAIEQHIALNESLGRQFFTYNDLTSIFQMDSVSAFVKNEIIEPLLQIICIAATVYSATVLGIYALSMHFTNPQVGQSLSSCGGLAADLERLILCPFLPSIPLLRLPYKDEPEDSIVAHQKTFAIVDPHQNTQIKLSSKIPLDNNVAKKSLKIETFDNIAAHCTSVPFPNVNMTAKMTHNLLSNLVSFNFDVGF